MTPTDKQRLPYLTDARCIEQEYCECDGDDHGPFAGRAYDWAFSIGMVTAIAGFVLLAHWWAA